jgi:putative addiction module component (TIGR02574 family)
MSATLTSLGIDKMTTEERLALVQEIWDSIAEEASLPGPTATQKLDLQRRLADLDANPSNVLTWEEIKARVKGTR